MATGDRIFFERAEILKNATLIEGSRAAEIDAPGYPIFVDPGGADAKGPEEIQAGIAGDVTVRIFGVNPIDLLALLGSAAENVILKIKGAAGANKIITIKSVLFYRSIGTIRVAAPDGGGMVTMWGIEGRAKWGGSDTYALMIVMAADT